MIKYIFLGFLFFSFQLLDAQITESFTDGDYTSNPTWTLASATDFSVNAGQLKSSNTTSNTSFYISTPSTLANNCQWEFFVNLQFATSSTNYVDVYLTADNSNLLAAGLNGYFVRIGNTSDDISLYKNVAGTPSLLIDGVNAVVSSSSNNLIKIKVTRTSANLFTLEHDMTGTGSSYVTEGTVTDATFTTASHFGFVVKQSTSTFFGKHIFDDITVGPIVLDVTPPNLVSASVISATAIDVLFNENVELTTSQTVSNYTLSPAIGTPVSATRDASNLKLVHLTLPSSLVSGTTYTLDVSNVQDASANAMTTQTTTFNYVVFSNPSFKDILINEIFADPSPVVNLTTCEYLELYNKSTSAFNLSGMKLFVSTSTSGVTLPSYSLPANAYVILCPIADTAQFTALGYMNKLGVSSFPSLTNSGTNVALKTGAGALIDSVNFSDAWYQNTVKSDGGYSLELINPTLNASCSQMSNWIASNDADGGTPGFVNSVFSTLPDLVGPKLISATPINSLQVMVCFNDAISVSQLTVTSNYAISGGVGTPTAAVPQVGNMCVLLSLGNPLINSTNYTLTVTGVTDCNGNTLTPNTIDFSEYKAKYQDVVINELMPDPDPTISLPNEEYIELKNRTNYNINLKNWKISSTTTTKKLPEIILKPDSFVVLVGTGAFNQFYNNFGITVYEVSSLPTLSNFGTSLTLRDSNNVMITSLSYTDDWYNDLNKKDGGWSMEQIDPNNPCGDITNWRASNHPNGGTPGFRNSVLALNPDNIAPKLDRIIVIDKDSIVLVFNESLDSATMTNPTSYVFDNGLTQPTYVLPISSEYKKVKLKLSSSMVLGTMYHVSVNGGLADCVGNLINTSVTLPFALPEPALENDVLINEVLFDPNTGGIDFVELYNRSNKTIDLKNIFIGSRDTITDVLKDTKAITTEGYLLFPETYLVISENQSTVKQQYQTINTTGFLDIVDIPSMNTDDDVVTLSDTAFDIIDELKYTSKMHFPLLVSTKGVSLERIDFNRPTDDRTNWNSAAEAVGFATPAYRNSQYLLADGGSGVTISQPLFSPDNDGYQDVLNISYKLDEVGKAANVFIFDSKGRQVRHLIKNEQLAQEGVWSWNGINDENEKAPIGIYVIYVELFNLSGKVNKYKLSCTLAGKL